MIWPNDTPAARGTFTPVSAAQALKITLGGSSASNETWQVTYGVNSASVTIGESYDFGSGSQIINTLSEIIKTLAAKINAANNDYSATTATDASIDTLVIARRVTPATAFNANFSITAPAVASYATLSQIHAAWNVADITGHVECVAYPYGGRERQVETFQAGHQQILGRCRRFDFDVVIHCDVAAEQRE